MSVATPANFPDALEPGLRQIFIDQYMMKEPMRTTLFAMKPMNTSYVKDSAIGSFGTFPVFNGQVVYDSLHQGEDVTFRPQQFASGFQISRDMVDDDLYDSISKEPRGLASAADETMEGYAADLFNKAFTGSGIITVGNVQIMNHTHGKSLCATDHGLGTARLPGVTLSNKGTSPLSATAVEATRRSMAKFLNDAGRKISVRPDLLLVHRDNEETGWQIIASLGQPDTAVNNANFHYGKYKLAVWDYLDSPKNWFFIDSQMMAMSLSWMDRVKLEFNQDKQFSTYIASYSAYMRASWGWSDWRWIFGHQVAA